MASPFNIFRRNQKIMLAVICVMAMFAFVFLDPLFKYLGRAGGSENPVVVKVNSHSYRATDLGALMQSRRIVRNFLQRLALQWMQKRAAGDPRFSSQQVLAAAENQADNWRQELMGRIVPPEDGLSDEDEASGAAGRPMEEAEAIQTVVLAAAAEQHGIVVTDQVINDYLKAITRNMVSPAEFEKIVGDMRSDASQMSQGYLFDALRREMLAWRYSFMFRVGQANVPPAPRWECFQQLNRRATAEVLGVPVQRFVQDVPEPSDTELKAFFTKYAEVLPVPNSPNPGFKRPAKAVFQYFLAKFSDFNERALAQVTPEEVREYYEKNKDVRYRERKPEPGAAAGETKPGEEKPGETTPGDASPPSTDQPEKTGAGDADGEKKPAAPSGAAPAPATDGDKKSSRSIPASSLHLTALVQKTDDKTPAAAPADTTPAAAADEKPAGGATGETAATEETGAAVDTSASGEAAPAASPTGGKVDHKKDVAYEPFEKVEDEIRKTLAGEKANVTMMETLQRLSVKMRNYSIDLNSYEANKEENPSLEAPEPLDLTALASAEGLEIHETDLVSADELYADTNLGKSFATPLDPRSPYGIRFVPFPQIGFTDRRYKPEITEDNDGNRYLSWKTKDTPEGVPDFDEVRRDVAREMKFIAARKLAVASAAQLAKEARTAEKPLTELLAGREGFEVIDTGAFTWMTIGSMAFDPSANRPRLSEVHGVQSAGQEFMEAVFNSTPDQVPVAMNEPKTVVYVIQIKAFDPARDDLEQQFLIEDFRKYAPLAESDVQSMYLDWLRWLDRQAGVTWLKPGVAVRRAVD